MAYEFDGKGYGQASTHQKEWGTRLIAELSLRGHEQVLDLGCGDGALTARLAARVPRGHVLGMDASEGMIAAASAHVAPNLHFVQQDINALDAQDAFDVVFSNATLHWIADHHALLQNVFHALRRGGFLRFNFAGEGNCAHFIRVVREATGHTDYGEAFGSFRWPWFMPSLSEYAGLMAGSPFREYRVWGENADRHFPDRDALIRWTDQPSPSPF